jgi:hypothetical protein
LGGDAGERRRRVRLKRTVRITLTQVNDVTVARGGGQGWCPRCADSVAMLTPEQAALAAGVSTRHVFRWLEAGRLHFVETAGLSPLVCAASLPAAARGDAGPAAAGDE